MASTNQHYVPQLLLKGFSSTKRKQVYVFDKSTSTVFRSSIRNVACERSFYDLDDGRGNSDHLDKWLTQLETTVAPILESIRARRRLDHLQAEARTWIGAFIAVQHVRTRHHRLLLADLNKQMAEALREMGAEPNSVQNFHEFTDSEMRDFMISEVPHTSRTLLPYVLDKQWLLLSAPTGQEFWIGDHPVVLANTMNPGNGIRGTLGFGVPGVEIYLPISSDLTLGCLCRTVPAMMHAAQSTSSRMGLPSLPRSGEFFAAFSGSVVFQLDVQNMKHHNSLQAIAAERFGFSRYGSFDLLRDMLSTDPRIASGPRLEIAGRPRHAKSKR